MGSAQPCLGETGKAPPFPCLSLGLKGSEGEGQQHGELGVTSV